MWLKVQALDSEWPGFKSQLSLLLPGLVQANNLSTLRLDVLISPKRIIKILPS